MTKKFDIKDYNLDGLVIDQEEAFKSLTIEEMKEAAILLPNVSLKGDNDSFISLLETMQLTLYAALKPQGMTLENAAKLPISFLMDMIASAEKGD